MIQEMIQSGSSHFGQQRDGKHLIHQYIVSGLVRWVDEAKDPLLTYNVSYVSQ